MNISYHKLKYHCKKTNLDKKLTTAIFWLVEFLCKDVIREIGKLAISLSLKVNKPAYTGGYFFNRDGLAIMFGDGTGCAITDDKGLLNKYKPNRTIRVSDWGLHDVIVAESENRVYLWNEFYREKGKIDSYNISEIVIPDGRTCVKSKCLHNAIKLITLLNDAEEEVTHTIYFDPDLEGDIGRRMHVFDEELGEYVGQDKPED